MHGQGAGNQSDSEQSVLWQVMKRQFFYSWAWRYSSRLVTSLTMTPQLIKHGLDELAARDPDVDNVIRQIGYPPPRERPPGFATLVNIIAGQQVSSAAATAIRDRLYSVVNPLVPDKLLAADNEVLRATGLSGRKIEYAKGLAEQICNGQLDLDCLAEKSDADVVKILTSVRGLGRWSAEIYLLFSLKRTDVWPAEDLAISEALRELKSLNLRPNREQSESLVEHWRPWRGVAALLLWYYYSQKD